MAARAGRAVREQAWIRNQPACSSCGHLDAHRELQPTLDLVDGVFVETPNPGYVPAVFHCTHDGCSCVLDLRAG
jgi:hypothetical protein